MWTTSSLLNPKKLRFTKYYFLFGLLLVFAANSANIISSCDPHCTAFFRTELLVKTGDTDRSYSIDKKFFSNERTENHFGNFDYHTFKYSLIYQNQICKTRFLSLSKLYLQFLRPAVISQSSIPRSIFDAEVPLPHIN